MKIEYRNLARVKTTTGVLVREELATQRYLITVKVSRGWGGAWGVCVACAVGAGCSVETGREMHRGGMY